MAENLKTIAAMQEETEVAVLIADQMGLITHVNSGFEKMFGWCKSEITGCSLSTIIPSAFHDAHNLGFSRFMGTGKPKLLGQPLQLKVLDHAGNELSAEHFLIAEEQAGGWVFGATFRATTDVPKSV